MKKSLSWILTLCLAQRMSFFPEKNAVQPYMGKDKGKVSKWQRM